MLPVLTFATGLIAGIVGVQLLKKTKIPDKPSAAARLDQAQTGLRQAAVSGLAAVEKSSACLRAKLTPAEASADIPQADPAPVEEAPAAPNQDATRQEGPAPARERDA